MAGSEQAVTQNQRHDEQQQQQSAQNMIVLATGGYDEAIILWDATSGKQRRRITHGGKGPVNRIISTKDKSQLIAAVSYEAKAFDIEQGEQQQVIATHRANITDIGVFEKNQQLLYTCSEDRMVMLWDRRQPRAPARAFLLHAPVCSVIGIEEKNQLVAADEDGVLFVLDFMKGQCISERSSDRNVPMRCITACPKASHDPPAGATDADVARRLVAGNERGHIYTLQLKNTGPIMEVLDKLECGHDGAVLRGSVSMDSSRLATSSSDGSIKIWHIDADSGSLTVQTWPDEPPRAGVVGTDQLGVHQGWVWESVFSVDAEFVVSASSDKSAGLWVVKSGVQYMQYKGHHRGLLCCALNDRQD